MSTLSNAPESANLTKEQRQLFNAALEAGHSLTKTFEIWITFARGVECAREMADKIGSRSAFQRILEQQGLAGFLGNTWSSQKSTANKLLAILGRLPEVEQWRESLTRVQKINWAAPTTIYKHCPLFKSEQDLEGKEDTAELAKIDKPKLGNNYAESQVDALTAKIEALEAALKAMKEKYAELEIENMMLKAQLATAPKNKNAKKAVSEDMKKRNEELN